FDEADIQYIREQFEKNESEVKRLLEKGLVYPAYDYLIKATHAFNLLDARGAVSPKERQGYIKRIRDLARDTAKQYTRDRDE
ncbi:MAG: glycine--tRNA ligase subunit alpha, partial [candidate division WOR-3 bacterium]|nr:glycine--tRNA ligase subunit alpha [candidate division WOR-3 bacterium]